MTGVIRVLPHFFLNWRIPTVPESSSSVLFSAIRVITVNPGTMSQQPHKDKVGWEWVSVMELDRKQTFYQAFVLLIFFLSFILFFYFCCLPWCFLCYLQGFGSGAENEVKDLVEYGKVKARIAWSSAPFNISQFLLPCVIDKINTDTKICK